MADETQYACPFCGEMSAARSRGKHYAWHRRQGDVPLALNGSVGRDDDESGTWSPVVTIAESNAPVLVPLHFMSKATKRSAEQALRKFVQSIANGTGSKAAPTDVKEVGTPTPRTGNVVVSDEDIVAALAKLAGVTSIPTKQFQKVTEWVTLTRTIVKEVAR